MITIGIDVSKRELACAAVARTGKLLRTFTLPNTERAITSFLLKTAGTHSSFTIACEATGDYHRQLALSSIANDIPCVILNPILTKQLTRATVRNAKTDPADAVAIARLALRGEGTLASRELFLPEKYLMRTSVHLARIRHELTMMHRHLVGVAAGSTRLQSRLESCVQLITDTQELFTDEAVLGCDPRLIALLTSIPGVGGPTATALVAEIGDINRFASGKALVAYAGLDPKVRQSGTSLHHNTRITKRGSPYLRRALFIAAAAALRSYDEFVPYVSLKQEQGRCYTERVIMVARKIAYRVHAVWKRETPYVLCPQDAG